MVVQVSTRVIEAVVLIKLSYGYSFVRAAPSSVNTPCLFLITLDRDIRYLADANEHGGPLTQRRITPLTMTYDAVAQLGLVSVHWEQVRQQHKVS